MSRSGNCSSRDLSWGGPESPGPDRASGCSPAEALLDRRPVQSFVSVITMQYCFFVLLSHPLSVKLASHVHHFIARPLCAAPQGGGLVRPPSGFFPASTSVTTLTLLLQILKKEEAIPWPGTLAIVHSYIAYKEGDFGFFVLVPPVTDGQR